MSTTSSSGGWLGQLERANGAGAKHELWELPATLTDPFATEEQRLAATLDTFRYSTDARALIDWACAQTGLDDPLSKYTRHELEQAFPRFARDRDQHLRQLMLDLKRRGQLRVLYDARNRTRIPAARSALDKFLKH